MNILGIISGSILFMVFGSIIAVIILLVGTALFLASMKEKKRQQNLADRQLLSNYFYEFYENFNNVARKRYMALPNYAMRRKFLQEEQPEFWSALQRATVYGSTQPNPERNIEEGYIAKYIDFRFLKWQDGGFVLNFDESFEIYLDNKDSSLADLQMHLDKVQERKQEIQSRRAAAIEKQEALRAKQEAERLAKVKADKEAANIYWESLSDEDKKNFKKARGRSARERALPNPANSAYTVDTLYPFIISTHFSGISPNTSISLTDCETSSASSSSYSYDSGSSYSSSDSSSSCDGGSF